MMTKFLQRKNKKGQSLAEYGLILGLVSIVAIGALSSLGATIEGVFGTIEGALAGV